MSIQIIQGGMGIGVSNWALAKEVSKQGELGVVSGTGLDTLLIRRLQKGDREGDMRRALNAFPFQSIAQKILDTFFVPGGISEKTPFKRIEQYSLRVKPFLYQICVAANFTEVWLAKEGHSNPVGINFLEKVQLSCLPSLYGAILAGVDSIIMGAGIPLEIPKIIKELSENKEATLNLRVEGAPKGSHFFTKFNPKDLFKEPLPKLKKPQFLPIVSSNFLALLMAKKASAPIDGLIIENHKAGGHNAPPRGVLHCDKSGEPLYGEKDSVDLKKIKELNLPFYLAGSWSDRDSLKKALSLGASGIQVGSFFALAKESGITEKIKTKVLKSIEKGQKIIKTDIKASPTGFPFKVFEDKESLANPLVYKKRKPICNLGYLRQPFIKEDGSLGFRCPADNPKRYSCSESSTKDETEGKKCLCNALFATIGLGSIYKNGYKEPPLITLGKKLDGIRALFLEKKELKTKDILNFLKGQKE